MALRKLSPWWLLAVGPATGLIAVGGGLIYLNSLKTSPDEMQAALDRLAEVGIDGTFEPEIFEFEDTAFAAFETRGDVDFDEIVAAKAAVENGSGSLAEVQRLIDRQEIRIDELGVAMTLPATGAIRDRPPRWMPFLGVNNIQGRVELLLHRADLEFWTNDVEGGRADFKLAVAALAHSEGFLGLGAELARSLVKTDLLSFATIVATRHPEQATWLSELYASLPPYSIEDQIDYDVYAARATLDLYRRDGRSGDPDFDSLNELLEDNFMGPIILPRFIDQAELTVMALYADAYEARGDDETVEDIFDRFFEQDNLFSRLPAAVASPDELLFSLPYRWDERLDGLATVALGGGSGTDQFGSEFVLETDRIVSAGRDGQMGTDDDSSVPRTWTAFNE